MTLTGAIKVHCKHIKETLEGRPNDCNLTSRYSRTGPLLIFEAADEMEKETEEKKLATAIAMPGCLSK